MGNPDDELRRRIDEVGMGALAKHTEDPLGSTIRHLEDMLSEHEGWAGGEFVAGYQQAVHDAKDSYIAYSRHFECRCRLPFPEEGRDGSWACGRCGEQLVGPGEDPFREDDD